MLKAVRFDLEEHAELIEFVENYRDKKNKPNHSEAIRLLMSKGLEVLNKQPDLPQPTIDVEKLKNEIFNQLMAQVNTMNIVQPQQPKQITPVEQEIYGVKQSTPKPPSQIAKSNINPLLANILGNSDR